MTDRQAVTIEQKAMLVQSELDEKLIYAIRRDGKGLHIYYKDTEIPIAAENVTIFLAEAYEIWQEYGKRFAIMRKREAV